MFVAQFKFTHREASQQLDAHMLISPHKYLCLAIPKFTNMVNYLEFQNLLTHINVYNYMRCEIQRLFFGLSKSVDLNLYFPWFKLGSNMELRCFE